MISTLGAEPSAQIPWIVHRGAGVFEIADVAGDDDQVRDDCGRGGVFAAIPDQTAEAKGLIANAEVFVATAVLLETEWVLRGAYRLAKSDILAALPTSLGFRP